MSNSTPKDKSVTDTQIEDYTYRVFPNDLNSNGTVFGGLITSILDRVALVIAEKHTEQSCVTASIDALHFLAPAGRGDNLIIKGSINRCWNTSLEIGVKVVAEPGKGGEKKHIVSAYFTFVALDENNKPSQIPKIIPKTDKEKRRYEEAELRRENRIQHAEMIKKSRNR